MITLMFFYLKIFYLYDNIFIMKSVKKIKYDNIKEKLGYHLIRFFLDKKHIWIDPLTEIHKFNTASGSGEQYITVVLKDPRRPLNIYKSIYEKQPNTYDKETNKYYYLRYIL